MFLKDLFFKNFFTKLISLALAVLLWSFVVGQEKAEINLSVPVTLVNIPDDMVVANDFPANVNVRVSGPKTLLARLSTSTPTKVIDLRDAEAGAIKVEITADDFALPGGVSISRIKPSDIELVLEPLVSRQVAIVPRLYGEVNSDYILDNVSVSPSSISVSGPKSKLAGLKELETRPVDISNAMATFMRQVKVDIPYDYIRSAETEQVKVTVNITPARGMEKFDGIRVVAEPAVSGVDISPGKISITAAGEKPRLHHIHTGEIKAVAHIAGLGKGKHRLKPEIILPFGLKLIQSYPEHVTVKLDRDLPDTANGTAEKGLAGR